VLKVVMLQVVSCCFAVLDIMLYFGKQNRCIANAGKAMGFSCVIFLDLLSPIRGRAVAGGFAVNYLI